MTKWTGAVMGGDRGSVALKAPHVVILFGDDGPAVTRLYGALCLTCGAKVADVYVSTDKARRALDRRARHAE